MLVVNWDWRGCFQNQKRTHRWYPYAMRVTVPEGVVLTSLKILIVHEPSNMYFNPDCLAFWFSPLPGLEQISILDPRSADIRNFFSRFPRATDFSVLLKFHRSYSHVVTDLHEACKRHIADVRDPVNNHVHNHGKCHTSSLNIIRAILETSPAPYVIGKKQCSGSKRKSLYHLYTW